MAVPAALPNILILYSIMTAIHPLRYTWSYREPADLSRLAYHKLIFWNDGICLLGYSEEHTIVAAKSLGFDPDISAETFTGFLMDEPLLGGGEPVTQLLVFSDRQMLIPEGVFDVNASEGWFRSLHFVDTNEAVEVFALHKPKAVALEAVRRDLISVIKGIYADVAVLGFSNHLLNFFDEGAGNVGVTILGDKAVLQAYRFQQLHALKVTDASEGEVLQFIAALQDTYGMKQEDVRITVSGYGDRLVPVMITLRDFFATREHLLQESFFNAVALCGS